jgi:toxin secretion/phage lysis holin
MNDSLALKLLAFIVGGSAATAIETLVGDIPTEWKTLGGLMIVDIITGFLCGFKGKSIASSTLGAGMKKKAGELAIIIALGFVNAPDALTVVLLYGFCGVEFLSIVENCKRLGVRIPASIASRLAVLPIAPTDAAAPDTPPPTEPETTDAE